MTPCSSTRREEVLGVEPVLEDERRVAQQREHRDHPLRRVVHRAADPLHRRRAIGAVAVGEVEHRTQRVRHQGPDLRRATELCQAAAHPLGPTGRARRVEHRAPTSISGRPAVTIGRGHVDEGDRVVGRRDVAHHDAQRHLRSVGRREGVAHDVPPAGVDHHRCRPGIVEHVADLVGDPVPVEWHEQPPRLHAGEGDLDQLDLVAEHRDDAVALDEPARAQPVDETPDPFVQLRPRGHAGRVDHRRRVGMDAQRRVEQGAHRCSEGRRAALAWSRTMATSDLTTPGIPRIAPLTSRRTGTS